MTVRNLDAFSAPHSVALIGASHRPGSVGNRVALNLVEAGFKGRLSFVNPKGGTLAGIDCLSSIDALPEAPDLAVVCIPAEPIPGLVAELAAKGTRGVVVISAGFGGGEEAQARRQALLDGAEPHLTRIVGPNCVGLLMPRVGLNASFVHMTPKLGEIGFVSQSGAVMAGIVDWAAPRGIGFSQMWSVGDMADVDFGDLLNHLANDRDTKVILMYVEAVTSARKFMSAARAAARAKPVIVMKAGRTAQAARAAASHTGAIAGADDIYDAAFRRAGILRVTTLNQLFGAAALLSHTRRLDGERLAIVTNGGGFGVLATDDLIAQAGLLAELGEGTVATLDQRLPAHWSRANPVDIIGDADGARYAGALEAVLDDDGVDAVLVMNCPTGISSSLQAAEAVAATVQARAKPMQPVLAAWIGDAAETNEARHRLEQADVPTYATPSEAVGAFMHLVRYQRGQAELMETPPSLPADFQPDVEAAARLIDEHGEGWLPEPQAKALFAAYGIPTTVPRIARDADEAAAVAGEIGFPVVVKVLSPDILHKSDVGGVLLNLGDAQTVATAVRQLAVRLEREVPDARIDGFLVEPMVRRRQPHELILGVTVDRLFGPVLLFGAGGTAVEVLRDRALALPPLNLALARRMIEETRIYRLLRGYRDQRAADLDAIALALVKLSQLVVDHPDVAEVDINPLLVDADGIFAVDARVRLAPAADPERLAIRPYPREWEGTITDRDGRVYAVRPVRPEDEPGLVAGFRQLSPETVRLRFFSPLKDMSHRMAARLTQIDYDREIALVALDSDQTGFIVAVVRLAADPDGQTGEFAIVVGDPVAGRGLGSALLQRLVEYGRARGLAEVFGIVLRENVRMLDLCRRLGFETQSVPGEPELIRVAIQLKR
ncbi:MAG: bifunctional acetate--CoA ligase family protein/GNAT family N-acetyltransferase [Alphaproteobacteria bacterium]